MTEAKQSGIEQKQLNPTSQPFLSPAKVNLAGDGDLIYVAFQVDPLMKQAGQIYLKDEETNKVYRPAVVPRVGMLISSRKKPGSSGYCIINNTNYEIKVGSKVSLVIGGYRQENIEVTY